MPRKMISKANYQRPFESRNTGGIVVFYACERHKAKLDDEMRDYWPQPHTATVEYNGDRRCDFE